MIDRKKKANNKGAKKRAFTLGFNFTFHLRYRTLSYIKRNSINGKMKQHHIYAFFRRADKPENKDSHNYLLEKKSILSVICYWNGRERTNRGEL